MYKYKKSCLFIFLSVFCYAGGDILLVPINFDDKVVIEPQSIVVEKNNKLKIVPSIEKEMKKLNKSLSSNKYYIGISLSQASFDGNINIGTLKNGHPLAVIGKVGYNFSENIALEARAGIGLKKDTIATVTNEWENMIGIYVKPKIHVMKKLEFFGLLGYSTVKHKVNNSSIAGNGFSYGGGASYTLDESWSLDIDAVRYAKNANDDLDAYSIGINYKF